MSNIARPQAWIQTEINNVTGQAGYVLLAGSETNPGTGGTGGSGSGSGSGGTTTTPVWTTYAYDGIGPTVSVTAPDGASRTTYFYSGADVTVTDVAGKWKTFTTDALGNLVVVKEMDPVNGLVTTSYDYTVLNQLTTVTMPRGGTKQTRSFKYGARYLSNIGEAYGVGPYLMSATNPENGKVTNSYNSDGTLGFKTDAKGQSIVYGYDSYKRVTQISKYPNGYSTALGAVNVEDVCQRVNYYYDTNPDDANYSGYAAGRLTSVHYSGAGSAACGLGQPPSPGTTWTSGNSYIEMYSYKQEGLVQKEKFRLSRTVVTYPNNQSVASGDLEATYGYDAEGKMLTQSYPLGTTYSYGYDDQGRAYQMTDTATNQNLVAAVTYGPAGELQGMTGTAVSESRTYNVNGQLIGLTGANGMNLTYSYGSGGTNNGQILSQYDATSGETITYAYDSLKRLASASSSPGWGQGFSYDGFGNLTAKTALSGAPPVGVYAVDPATNRLAGVAYDANGNQWASGGMSMAYDVSNRMVSTSNGPSYMSGLYEYDPSNKRVYQARAHYDSNLGWVTDSAEFYFYGITGQKLGRIRLR